MTTNPADGTGSGSTGLKAIPKGIWALGLVSLFMDTSSELIHSLLPIFLVTTLGASALSVGLIEGIAEATASIVKVFSGTLSDYLGKRKLLAVIGYGLAAVTKPLFPLAGTVGLVFTARFIDRIGKGIRGAPRDALIGEIAPKHLLGACYGLRQSLDTVGAVAGPLLAILFMALLANDIRAVLWIAVIPALIAVAILVFGVKEPETVRPEGHVRSPIHPRELRGVGAVLWGLHMGLTQGLLSAMVANSTPARIRGTAFGVFHMVNGIALLAASLIAGLLWDRYGPPATFYADMVFTGIALAGLMVVRRRHPAAG
jgi:sugar phosphate permease